MKADAQIEDDDIGGFQAIEKVEIIVVVGHLINQRLAQHRMSESVWE